MDAIHALLAEIGLSRPEVLLLEFFPAQQIKIQMFPGDFLDRLLVDDQKAWKAHFDTIGPAADSPIMVDDLLPSPV